MTLDITRNNYLSWILDVKIYLNVMDFGDAIKKRNKIVEQLICSSNNKYSEFISCLLWLNKTMKLLRKIMRLTQVVLFHSHW